MRVVKFGGTSVRDAACLGRAAAVVGPRRAGGVVVVVSAAAGVTRRLLYLGHAAAASLSPPVEQELRALGELHGETLAGLDLEPGAAETTGAALRRLFEALRERLAAIAARGACEPADQDAVMAFGERLSSTLMHAALVRHGWPAQRIDARQVVITDARFRQARPDMVAIDARAVRTIAPLLAAGAVVVTEGFIGATPQGVTTTMGFEASDLTAALLGAALAAEEIEIRTDVPGMLTTGHPAVPQPRLVPRLSYDEAAELALFGAKVLHPDTVAPARARGIPLRILDAADPDGAGTWIGEETGLGDAGARTAPGGTRSSEEEGPRSGNARTARAGRVRAIAVTENPEDESFAGVRETLRRQHPGGWAGRSVVCPVGAGIGSAATVIDALAAALRGVPGAFPLERRPHALPVDVPRERAGEVVARLHAALIPM